MDMMDSLYYDFNTPTFAAGGGGGGSSTSAGSGLSADHNMLSLQEMIDSDIKADFDDVLKSDGLHSADLDFMKDIDLTSSLLFSSTNSNDGYSHLQPNSQNNFSLHSPHQFHGQHNATSDDLNLAGAVLVNPNNVMAGGQQQPSLQNIVKVEPMIKMEAGVEPPPPTVQRVIVQQSNQPQQVVIGNQQNYQVRMSTIPPSTTNSTNIQGQQIQQQRIVNQQGQVITRITPGSATPIQVANLQHPQQQQSTLLTTVKTVPGSLMTTGLPAGARVVSTMAGASMAGGLPTVVTAVKNPTTANSIRKKSQSTSSSNGVGGPKAESSDPEDENRWPKPAYSYSCLIALALKNSQTGSMSVAEIYNFMCEHFPYFNDAPHGWKNSVRHNLSLNKCFEKIVRNVPEGGANGNGPNARKGCLWCMNPAKIAKMDDEVLKWSRKDPQAIKKGMMFPNTLPALERGEVKKDYTIPVDYNGNTGGSPRKRASSKKAPVIRHVVPHSVATATVTAATVAAAASSSSAPSSIMLKKSVSDGLDLLMYEDAADGAPAPHTPKSVSSQGSAASSAQSGFEDIAGSDFMDIDSLNGMGDAALPEINLQPGSYEENQLSTTNPTQSVTRLPNGVYTTEIRGNYSITSSPNVSSNGIPQGTNIVIRPSGSGGSAAAVSSSSSAAASSSSAIRQIGKTKTIIVQKASTVAQLQQQQQQQQQLQSHLASRGSATTVFSA